MTGNVVWFSTRPKRRKSRASRSTGKASPQQLIAFRLTDFARLFTVRYGKAELPNDDSGRDDIEPVMHHLLALRQGGRHCMRWLENWAPWMTIAEHKRVIAEATDSQRIWTADQLAWRYNVTKEERTMSGLTTIGAIDQSQAARKRQRKERDKFRKRAKRRDAGALPRKAYLAASISRAKPWIADGVSRATWYRRRVRQVQQPDTGPSTP